eukprot:COSAG01_NODE_50841_length_360_cov_0.398467_1_plen_32_part_10
MRSQFFCWLNILGLTTLADGSGCGCGAAAEED